MAGPAATVRDGSQSAASAGWSRHGEHPGARVSIAEALIGGTCQQPQFAESDVPHSRRVTRNTRRPERRFWAGPADRGVAGRVLRVAGGLVPVVAGAGAAVVGAAAGRPAPLLPGAGWAWGHQPGPAGASTFGQRRMPAAPG